MICFLKSFLKHVSTAIVILFLCFSFVGFDKALSVDVRADSNTAVGGNSGIEGFKNCNFGSDGNMFSAMSQDTAKNQSGATLVGCLKDIQLFLVGIAVFMVIGRFVVGAVNVANPLSNADGVKDAMESAKDLIIGLTLLSVPFLFLNINPAALSLDFLNMDIFSNIVSNNLQQTKNSGGGSPGGTTGGTGGKDGSRTTGGEGGDSTGGEGGVGGAGGGTRTGFIAGPVELERAAANPQAVYDVIISNASDPKLKNLLDSLDSSCRNRSTFGNDCLSAVLRSPDRDTLNSVISTRPGSTVSPTPGGGPRTEEKSPGVFQSNSSGTVFVLGNTANIESYKQSGTNQEMIVNTGGNKKVRFLLSGSGCAKLDKNSLVPNLTYKTENCTPKFEEIA